MATAAPATKPPLPAAVTQVRDPIADIMAGAQKQTAALQAEQQAKEAEIKQQQEAAMAPLQQQRQAAVQDFQQGLQNGPEQLPMPENKAQHIDPKEMNQAAGLMMGLAALAGSMTRAPLTASLKAMTGAMQGLQAGDEQQFQRDYDTYKTEFDKAIAINKARVSEYDKVLKGKEFNLREMDAELTRIAKKYGDEVTANAKTYKDRIEIIRGQEKQAVQAQEHHDRLAQRVEDRAARLQQAREAAAQRAQFHADSMALRREKAGGGHGAGGEEGGEAAATAARAFLINNLAPPKGMQQAVMLEIGKIAKANGQTVEEVLAAGADAKSRMLAKRATEIRLQNMERAENQLRMEIPVLKDSLAALDQFGMKRLSSLNLARIREGIGTDKEIEAVAKLDQAAHTVFNEFEGIINGNPGKLNVSDVQNAKKNYESAQTPVQMKAVIESMERITNNAQLAVKKTREDTVSDVVGLFKPKPAVGPQPPAATAPTKPYSDTEKERRYQEWKAKHAQP